MKQFKHLILLALELTWLFMLCACNLESTETTTDTGSPQTPLPTNKIVAN